MKNRKTYTIQLVLIAAVIIALNMLSNKFYSRLDLTQDRIYTLSDATINILNDLNEPITVTVYLTEDLPAGMMKSINDFKSMLIEYADESNGMLAYEYIDPSKDKETERKAMENGVMPTLINVKEKDQVSQKKAYLGAIIQIGDQKETIPIINQGEGLEYALSSSIKKMADMDKITIGFIQGHGEPQLMAFQQVLMDLGVLYNVEPVNLNDSALNLNKYKTLALVAPTDSIPDYELTILDQYMANGGNLYLAIDRVEGNLQNLQGSEKNTGVESWLENKGLIVESNFVIDKQCNTVGVTQNNGFMRYTTQIPFPYLPRISNFSDHPVTKGLEQVVFEFASSIQYVGDTSITYLPLAWSSKKSGTQPVPTYFSVDKKWQDTDFPLNNLTVAALLEGKFKGQKDSRLVIITDGNFAVNGTGQRPRQVNPDNVNLMVNAIDWLSDDTGLVGLRTKGITSRPIDQMEDTKRTILKYTNFSLPLLLVIFLGLFRYQRNNRKRTKRMEDHYV